jgi:zinc transporter ZupT
MVPDKSLFTASKILERTIARRRNSIDRDCITNYPFALSRKISTKPQGGLTSKEYIDELKNSIEEGPGIWIGTGGVQAKSGEEDAVHHEHQEYKHHFHPKSNITPYLLLVALSTHGLFEGTALGVQESFKESLFLALAIIAHKWAESFTLGVSFFKSNTEKDTYVRMIILFSFFTPMGILIGILLYGTSPIIQGCFLAFSSGTFLYISASEVIVEEFAVTKYRYQKYFLYLCGGIMVALLSYMEAAN